MRDRLDTREIASKPIIVNSKLDVVIQQLKEGDYVSYTDKIMIELKIADDVKDVSRFKSECQKMAMFKLKNPNFEIHAIYVGTNLNNNYKLFKAFKEYQRFANISFSFGVWPHFCWELENLVEKIQNIKKHKYKYVVDFKRPLKKLSFRQKQLAALTSISTTKSIEASKLLHVPICQYIIKNKKIEVNKEKIISAFGRLKSGKPNKLSRDYIHFLETGFWKEEEIKDKKTVKTQ